MTSLLFSVLVVAVGSRKLTSNGTEKSWKGTSVLFCFVFLMHLTPVVTRKKIASISILLGDTEGE